MHSYYGSRGERQPAPTDAAEFAQGCRQAILTLKNDGSKTFKISHIILLNSWVRGMSATGRIRKLLDDEWHFEKFGAGKYIIPQDYK